MGKKTTEMSEKEKNEYNKMVENATQMNLFDMCYSPTIYGYARVSTKGQAREGYSLEAQEKLLRQNGATEIYKDAFTGKTTERPQLDKLLSSIQSGDTLVVTKIDRLARSVSDGLNLIQKLNSKGIIVHILNMGKIDDSAQGKLMLTMLLAFAEYERDMIIERCQEGRAVARLNPDYKEGRKKKFTQTQLDNAIKDLDTMTINEAAKQHHISRSTIQRELRRRKM